jgi:hypothetical protein
MRLRLTGQRAVYDRTWQHSLLKTQRDMSLVLHISKLTIVMIVESCSSEACSPPSHVFLPPSLFLHTTGYELIATNPPGVRRERFARAHSLF